MAWESSGVGMRPVCDSVRVRNTYSYETWHQTHVKSYQICQVVHINHQCLERRTLYCGNSRHFSSISDHYNEDRDLVHWHTYVIGVPESMSEHLKFKMFPMGCIKFM